MRLGSATTKLLPTVFLFPSMAFPNPVFINPAFASGQEVNSRTAAFLEFTNMGASGSGIAAFESVEPALPIGFFDLTNGQDYQLTQAGIGQGIGLSGSGLAWPTVSANTVPILLDFVAVPNFDFSQIQQGQIMAVTLDYQSAGSSINRAFTFDYADWGDPSAVPEPATLGLGALGLGAFAAAFWMRRKLTND